MALIISFAAAADDDDDDDAGDVFVVCFSCAIQTHFSLNKR